MSSILLPVPTSPNGAHNGRVPRNIAISKECDDMYKIDLTRDVHEHYRGYDIYVRLYAIPGLLGAPGIPDQLSKRYLVKICDSKGNILGDHTQCPIVVSDYNGPIMGMLDGSCVYSLLPEMAYQVKYKPTGEVICTFGGRLITQVEAMPFVSADGRSRTVPPLF